MGTIFLESYVCVGVHTRAECACVCVSAAEVCRHVCAGKVCVPCVCLYHCVSRVINTVIGAVTRAEKVHKLPQAKSGMGEGTY